MSQPVIRLSEVIEDDASAIVAASRQNDRWTRIRLRRHPRAVERVHDQEDGHNQDNTRRNLNLKWLYYHCNVIFNVVCEGNYTSW